MWKRALFVAALSAGYLFEEGGGCGSNHLLLYGGIGVGALLLGTVLGKAATTTST